MWWKWIPPCWCCTSMFDDEETKMQRTISWHAAITRRDSPFSYVLLRVSDDYTKSLIRRSVSPISSPCRIQRFPKQGIRALTSQYESEAHGRHVRTLLLARSLSDTKSDINYSRRVDEMRSPLFGEVVSNYCFTLLTSKNADDARDWERWKGEKNNWRRCIVAYLLLPDLCEHSYLKIRISSLVVLVIDNTDACALIHDVGETSQYSDLDTIGPLI